MTDPIEWSGANIRALRKHVRENQTEFSERIGLSGPSPVSNLEREAHEATPTMCRLLDYIASAHDWQPAGRDGAV
jgi:transcriptional regulator with XRE-family HTH domain